MTGGPLARSRVSGLLGAAAMITAVTLVARVLGFGRWMVQAGTVGHGVVGTAYNSANALPNVLFEVAAGGALAGALVPLLVGPIARGAREEVDRTVSAMLTWTLTALVPLAIVVALLARPLVTVFLPDAAPADQVDLTAHLLRVFAWQVPLYGVGVVLTGVLQARKRFFWPAFVPVLSTLVVMIAYLVFGALSDGRQDDLAALPSRAVAWLAWGTTAGVVALSLPLLAPAWRGGLRLRPTWRFPRGVAARALRLAGAGLAAVVAQQVALVATVWLSNNRGGDGAFTVFQYTQAVYLLPFAVLVVPLATSAFPRIADAAAVHARRQLSSLVAATSRVVVVLAGVGAAALVAAAPFVARAFAGIGRGDDRVIAAMGPTLALMAPGLLGFALVHHLTRVLYALERTRPAVLAASAGWGAVVLVSTGFAFAATRGGVDAPSALRALGAGSSVGMLVGGATLALTVRAVAGGAACAGLGRTVLVTVASAGAGAGLGRLLADAFAGWWTRWLGVGSEPGLATSVCAGAAGALLAVAVTVAGVWLLDRSALAGLRARLGAAGTAEAAAPGDAS